MFIFLLKICVCVCVCVCVYLNIFIMVLTYVLCYKTTASRNHSHFSTHDNVISHECCQYGMQFLCEMDIYVCIYVCMYICMYVRMTVAVESSSGEDTTDVSSETRRAEKRSSRLGAGTRSIHRETSCCFRCLCNFTAGQGQFYLVSSGGWQAYELKHVKITRCSAVQNVKDS